MSSRSLRSGARSNMKRPNTSRAHSLSGLRFAYDKRNDLLYVYKPNAAVFSTVVLGEFHLEFSRSKDVVGLEVLRAAEVLAEYGISRALLEHIERAELRVVPR